MSIVRRSTCTGGIALLGLFLGAAPLQGQEARELKESQWGRLGPDAAGKGFYLEARWDRCFGTQINIYKARLNDFLHIKPGPLQDLLHQNRDGGRALLISQVSNVRIAGTARLRGDGRSCFLDVQIVEKQKDDTEVYRERLGRAGEDAGKLENLAREAAARAELFDDEALRQISREIVQQEMRARQKQLAANDHQGALKLAERMEELGDERSAIGLLARVERSAPKGVRREARVQLRRMGAILDGGSWILYSDYKRGEGFVRQGDKWVSREEVEFDESVQREYERQKEDVVPVRLNPLEHLREAEAGKVSRGQNWAEVRLAGGFPERASHRTARAPGPQNPQRALWTQWILADGRRVYLLNGEVIRGVPASRPWPGE